MPLVDANMRELAATGFMSNRGRQNVASYLALDLQLDWRDGADHFESLLLDYDVCSNWGNWEQVTAGILYPSPFDDRGLKSPVTPGSTHALDHFVAYCRGAAGIA